MTEGKRRLTDNRRKLLRGLAGCFISLPLALAALALLAFGQRAALPAAAPAMLTTASYILALAGMALSAGFNRSRVFFVLLVAAAAETTLALPSPAGLNPRLYADGVFFFASVLLPLNVLAFSLLRERGLLSPAGKVRLGLVGGQFFAVAVMVVSQDADIAAFISRDSAVLAGKTALPRMAAGLFAATLLVLGIKILRTRSPVDGAFFWVLPVFAAVFHYKGAAVAQPLFFAAAAAVLAVAALQESYSIAYQDELTGLPSRRALQEELGRLGERYAVAMVDIDHFKKLNDSYGHDVGDDVLRLVAALIRDGAGEGRPFRYGGEEFTIIFPGREAAEVLPLLDELRARIAKRSFVVRGTAGQKRLTVTVSIGVAGKGQRPARPEEVLKAADEALYRAKAQGRNRVCN